MIRTMVREFVEAELRPVVEENERLGRLSRRCRRQDGAARAVRHGDPRGVGRRGARHRQLRRGDRGGGARLRLDGRDALGHELRLRVPDLPVRHRRAEEGVSAALASGRILGGFCLTEPGAGSDAGRHPHARRAARATRGSSHGEKAWVTNVDGRQGLHRLRGHATPTKGKKGISAFIVEPQFPGFRFGKVEEKMGLRASKTGDRSSSRTARSRRRTSSARRVRACRFRSRASNRGASASARRPSGSRRRRSRRRSKYARQRRAFGQPIAEFGAIQEKLAEMATLARRRAAAGHARGRPDRDAGRPGGPQALLDGQAVRDARRRTASPTRRCRSTAATAIRRSSPSSATTATRGSRRSTRGPARSSGS